MECTVPVARRYCMKNNLAEPPGVGKRSLLPLCHNGAGDTAGIALFSIAEKEIGEFVFRIRVDNVRSRYRARRVDPHVEGLGCTKGKPAPRFKVVKQGNAEIKQYDSRFLCGLRVPGKKII